MQGRGITVIICPAVWAGLPSHLHLLNSKHYHREKSVPRKNIFHVWITFSAHPLKSLCTLWKEYFSFSFDQTILFLCSPFVKVHLTNYHLSAGLREWDYPWHIHKTCPKENKKANIFFAFGLFLTNFLISKAERIVQ